MGSARTGRQGAGTVRLAALFTTGSEPDWPDLLDVHTGQFTYFGDNRSAGRELHATRRQGNALLRHVFDAARGTPNDRGRVCPFFLFEKAGAGRDIRFRGLLAPGSSRVGEQEELVAVWRTASGMRFQNYRAIFTVLDVPVVSRAWSPRSWLAPLWGSIVQARGDPGWKPGPTDPC